MQKIAPNQSKLADITPVFKKDDSKLAKSYRPVSEVHSASKLFERKWLFQYIAHFLSPFLWV